MSTTSEDGEQPELKVTEVAADRALNGFDVDNPNMVSECGCVESFRT